MIIRKTIPTSINLKQLESAYKYKNITEKYLNKEILFEFAHCTKENFRGISNLMNKYDESVNIYYRLLYELIVDNNLFPVLESIDLNKVVIDYEKRTIAAETNKDIDFRILHNYGISKIFINK